MAQKTLKTRGTKTNYPSDVSDEEWEFCAPYFCLMKEDAPQRDYSLRGMFNAVCYIVCAGCPWRMTPNDLPPWSTVHHKRERWIKAGCCACSPRSPSTFGGDPLWTHSAKHSGEWRARGLRRLQANKSGQVADLVKQVQTVTAPSVNATSRRGRPTRSPPLRGQVGRSQTRLCPAASALGGRTFLRLGQPFILQAGGWQSSNSGRIIARRWSNIFRSFGKTQGECNRVNIAPSQRRKWLFPACSIPPTAARLPSASSSPTLRTCRDRRSPLTRGRGSGVSSPSPA